MLQFFPRRLSRHIKDYWCRSSRRCTPGSVGRTTTGIPARLQPASTFLRVQPTVARFDTTQRLADDKMDRPGNLSDPSSSSHPSHSSPIARPAPARAPRGGSSGLRGRGGLSGIPGYSSLRGRGGLSIPPLGSMGSGSSRPPAGFQPLPLGHPVSPAVTHPGGGHLGGPSQALRFGGPPDGGIRTIRYRDILWHSWASRIGEAKCVVWTIVVLLTLAAAIGGGIYAGTRHKGCLQCW
jgi:hypothetical protein